MEGIKRDMILMEVRVLRNVQILLCAVFFTCLIDNDYSEVLAAGCPVSRLPRLLTA